MIRAFLIDGSAVAYQTFHALRGLHASDGRPMGAVFGFARMLAKLWRNERPTHLAVAWDAAGPTFRHELAEDYKATRSEMPEDLRAQVPILRELCAALRVPFLEAEGFEADDILATLVAAAGRHPDGADVALVTKDKDCRQLLSPHVHLYDFGTEARYGIEELDRAFQLTPAQWVDYQSLVGDSSDNVRGAKGIGPKTAAALLRDWGTVDGIYGHLDDVPTRARNLLEQSRDDVARAAELVRLRDDVPLDVHLDDLVLRRPDEERLDALCDRLGFQRLARELLAPFQSPPSAGSAVAEAPALDESDYVLVTNAAELHDLVAAMRSSSRIGIHAVGDEAGLALADRPGRAFYVPLRSPQLSLDAGAVAVALAPILRARSTAKVAAGLGPVRETLSWLEREAAASRGRVDLELGGRVEDALEGFDPSGDALATLAEERLGCYAVTPAAARGADPNLAEALLARVAELGCEGADLALRLQPAPALAEASGAAPRSDHASLEQPVAHEDGAPRVVRVGILGLPGAGKSTVARHLAERGCLVLDADALVAEAYRDHEVQAAVRRELGDDLIDDDGRPVRERIAAVVFTDPVKRKRLEELIHPYVRRRMREEVEALAERVTRGGSDVPVAVYDVPLLAEGGLHEECDLFVFVEVSRDTRLARVASRGWDAAELDRRDAAQWSAERKQAVAGVRPLHVIHNDGDDQVVAAELAELWQLIENQLP